MYVLPTADITYLEKKLLTDTGELRILPYAELAAVPQEHLSQLCVQQGLYCIPTVELITWLRRMIMTFRPIIEVGAGNGAIARALSIPATDNRMQEDPEIRAVYDRQRQAPVRYGANVEKLDALAAVEHYRPHTVIAAWVTHKYNPLEDWRGGNMYGVDEGAMLKKIKRYIFIGNEFTHLAKPLLALPHETFKFKWLLSRSMKRDQNVIWVWER